MSSIGFSRTVEGTRDTSHVKVFYPKFYTISRQSDFSATSGQEEERTLPQTPTCFADVGYVTMQYPVPGLGVLTQYPVDGNEKSVIQITLHS